jgi:hypothetical protein
MTTKPTPIQARAYADALVAWSEGKKVEQRWPGSCITARTVWFTFDGDSYVSGAEYRIVPDPPKAREWWANVYPAGASDILHESREEADEAAGRSRVECMRVRQILDTEIVVDKAEYEELRRNGAALKVAIAEWLSDNHISLRDALAKHGAELR